MKGVSIDNEGGGTTSSTNVIDFFCILVTHYEKSCPLQLVLFN
jgi:hypothetical protein